MKNFALIGAAGYVAPRHMKAIKDTGNQLIAALDKFDSVGILDSFFPKADFFVEFERFDRHLEKLKRQGTKIDYISVCSPNYLHDAHIRFGLRLGANVICEKPLVLNPWNLKALEEIEKSSEGKVYTILQLRLHPSVIELKKKVDTGPTNEVYDVDLTYLTSRGHWYYTSWKGDISKSGGIATNIGIHFFDMLCWIFGNVKENIVHVRTHDRAAGYLILEKAKVKWFLSINSDVIPSAIQTKGAQTFRSLKIEGQEFEFSSGFHELHTHSYEKILQGEGFSLEKSKKAIQLVHDIRHVSLTEPKDNHHPLTKTPEAPHPFGSLKNSTRA